MTMIHPEPENLRTASVSRVMNVPARYIFLAYTTPAHLRRWFGPVGYPVTMCESDFRVGGKWRMVMTGPDGVQGPAFGGTYLEITPHSRIVYDNGFEDPSGGDMHIQNPGRMIMTTTFDEIAGQTTVTVTTLFDTIAMKDEYLGIGMAEGTLSGLDQLQDVARELSQQE
jgi:uncharacterized protein YndB with AHSA1/START domain